jgi:hypothetical protein
MTPLPNNSSDASANPQPPVPAAPADATFVPADGIVSTRAPYSTAAGTAQADNALEASGAQPNLFDPPARTENAPAGDHDALPEKVTDGRSGSAH